MSSTRASTPAPAPRRVSDFAVSLQRAIKSARLYPSNNPTRAQHLEAAHAQLAEIVRGRSALDLAVRDGELFFEGEVVFSATERDAFTHVLFDGAIHRVSFADGIDAAELGLFVAAIATDFSRRGEDLVAGLWRLDMPHVRYRHFDVLAVAVAPGTTRGAVVTDAADDEETRRLRRELARVVAQLSIDQRDGSDVMTLPADALETPELVDIGKETLARACAPQQVSAFAAEVARKEEQLSVRMIELILGALCRDETEPTAALEHLAQLFDQLADYGDAARVITTLTQMRDRAQSRAAFEIMERLLTRFGMDDYVARAIAALNATGSVKIIAYLRALGPFAAASLLARASEVEREDARRMICELIVELTTDDRGALYRTIATGRWEIACELLAAPLPEPVRAKMIEHALTHAHARPRVDALRMLARVQSAAADDAISAALGDDDQAVRMAAMRLAGARGMSRAIGALSDLLRHSGESADPRELQLAAITLASIAGERAIPDLQRVLTDGAGLFSSRPGALSAAAFGLASIDSERAKSILEKGARSLNLRIRAACAEALEKGPPARPSSPPRSSVAPRKIELVPLSSSKEEI